MAHQSPFETLGIGQLRERRNLKWSSDEPDVLPLWVAEMDAPLAPPITEALAAAVRRGDTGYAVPGGLPAAFADFALRRYGWRPETTAIGLAGDVMSGVEAALTRLTVPGDTVIVSTPVYPPFFIRIGRLGRKVVSSPLRYDGSGYRLDLDRLEWGFATGAKIYLLCNPHNPTGLVFSREELTAIGELADRYGVTVVSDEIHAPLTKPGVRHVPFATIPAESASRGYSAHAASKAWNLPGLKTALLVAGPTADRSILDHELSSGAGILGAIAAEAAFTEGEAWLDEVRAGIDQRAGLLAGLLAKRLPEVGYRPPAGTYLAWLDFRAYHAGDDPALTLRHRARVSLYSGPDFGDEGRGFARLTLATSRSILTEAVDRLCRVLTANSTPTASR